MTRKSSGGVSGKANDHHPLYRKIFCSECEAPFVRKTVLKETLEDGTRIYKKVWKCAEREKGKKGKGCKNKVILEETLLKEISLQMEWEWSGIETFPMNRMDEIEYVKVGKEGIAVYEK